VVTGLYRVELRLENSIGLGPEWLPAAVRSSMQSSELYSVESYSDTSAVVLIRSGRRPAVGESVTAGAEGMSLPLAASPRGSIINVSEAVDAALPSAQGQEKAAIKVLGAVGLLAIVCWLVSRIP
jgi:hypothetical protein